MASRCIDLAAQADVRVERVLDRGGAHGIVREQLAIGSCAAGWWLAVHARGRTRAWLCGDYRAACDRADRRVRAGGWTELEVQACAIPS